MRISIVTPSKHIGNWIKALHYDIMSPTKGGDCMGEDTMTGREIVNLINALEKEGMTAEKIIEIIKYVEMADPKEPSNN